MRVIETVGDLVNLMEEYDRLAHCVKESERALAFGGSAETVRAKARTLDTDPFFLQEFLNTHLSFKEI